MSRQDDSDFVLLNKAKDLYVYTSEAVGNDKIIPRRRFRTIGQRLESLALDIYSKTQLANEKNRERDFVVRQGLQDEVIALCLTFEGLVNALKASAAYPGVNAHKAEVWTRKSMDVRYICAAWRDHERARRSTLPWYSPWGRPASCSVLVAALLVLQQRRQRVSRGLWWERRLQHRV